MQRKKWMFLCLIVSYRRAEIPRVFKETKGRASLEKIKCKHSAFFEHYSEGESTLKHLCFIIGLGTKNRIVDFEIYFLISIFLCVSWSKDNRLVYFSLLINVDSRTLAYLG